MRVLSDFASLVHPVDCLVVVRNVVFLGVQGVENVSPGFDVGLESQLFPPSLFLNFVSGLVSAVVGHLAHFV